MNSSDKIELLRLAKENVRLQRLLDKHQTCKEQLRLLRKKGMLTANEEQEVRDLKLKKLRSKDEMIRIVRSLKTITGSDISTTEQLRAAG